MASSLPLPLPPRTPTPPSPAAGDNQDGLRASDPAFLMLNHNSLSPRSDTFSPQFGSMTSPMLSSAGFTASPALSDTTTTGPPPGTKNPFNFQTQTMREAPVMAKSVCATFTAFCFQYDL